MNHFSVVLDGSVNMNRTDSPIWAPSLLFGVQRPILAFLLARLQSSSLACLSVHIARDGVCQRVCSRLNQNYRWTGTGQNQNRDSKTDVANGSSSATTSSTSTSTSTHSRNNAAVTSDTITSLDVLEDIILHRWAAHRGRGGFSLDNCLRSVLLDISPGLGVQYMLGVGKDDDNNGKEEEDEEEDENSLTSHSSSSSAISVLREKHVLIVSGSVNTEDAGDIEATINTILRHNRRVAAGVATRGGGTGGGGKASKKRSRRGGGEEGSAGGGGAIRVHVLSLVAVPHVLERVVTLTGGTLMCPLSLPQAVEYLMSLAVLRRSRSNQMKNMNVAYFTNERKLALEYRKEKRIRSAQFLLRDTAAAEKNGHGEQHHNAILSAAVFDLYLEKRTWQKKKKKKEKKKEKKNSIPTTDNKMIVARGADDDDEDVQQQEGEKNNQHQHNYHQQHVCPRCHYPLMLMQLNSESEQHHQPHQGGALSVSSSSPSSLPPPLSHGLMDGIGSNADDANGADIVGGISSDFFPRVCDVCGLLLLSAPDAALISLDTAGGPVFTAPDEFSTAAAIGTTVFSRMSPSSTGNNDHRTNGAAVATPTAPSSAPSTVSCVGCDRKLVLPHSLLLQLANTAAATTAAPANNCAQTSGEGNDVAAAAMTHSLAQPHQQQQLQPTAAIALRKYLQDAGFVCCADCGALTCPSCVDRTLDEYKVCLGCGSSGR